MKRTITVIFPKGKHYIVDQIPQIGEILIHNIYGRGKVYVIKTTINVKESYEDRFQKSPTLTTEIETIVILIEDVQ